MHGLWWLQVYPPYSSVYSLEPSSPTWPRSETQPYIYDPPLPLHPHTTPHTSTAYKTKAKLHNTAIHILWGEEIESDDKEVVHGEEWVQEV